MSYKLLLNSYLSDAASGQPRGRTAENARKAAPPAQGAAGPSPKRSRWTARKKARMSEKGRLATVGFVSIASTTQRQIGAFTLDPEIPLPVDIPEGGTALKIEELSWEAIVAGALKVLAWDPENAHGLLPAVRPRGQARYSPGVHPPGHPEGQGRRCGAGHRGLSRAGRALPR